MIYMNLDTGNHLPLGEDVIEFASKFRQQILSCHFKNVHYVCCDHGAVLTGILVKYSIIDLTKIPQKQIACWLTII